MKCPKCQFENREGAKFCNECGHGFDIECPECRAVNRAGSKFCDECGHELLSPETVLPINFNHPQSYTPKHLVDKILTTRSSIEGERKIVTVFFADVANYTALAEKLDPEDVHQIMDGCFQILLDEIHRFEGTINQFTGDGVMALFGAPVAHEDHAQRACYAALSSQKALREYGEKVKEKTGKDFAMRIGLNTGPVMVGSIGDDLRMDYTAVGDTTNLAARIEQNAKPGEVWISQDTQSIISDYFQVEFAGNYEMKGKSDKQPVYILLAEKKDVRTRFEAGLARGVTGLVGRKPEMETLSTAWERAKNGEVRLVDVVGEAGVGKSRLIYEFQKKISGEATFLTGVCIHYGRNISFLPMIEIVKSAFGIIDGMSEEQAGSCMRDKATGDLSKMIPFYQNLLSLEVNDEKFNALNPEGRKFGTFEAVKDLLLFISKAKPVIVFLEDVHWIDKISEEFFTFFSRSMQGHKILMLSAHRPEGTPGWAKGPYYRHLGLETLSGKSSGRLIRNILGEGEVESELEQLIVTRAGGNPLFVEEMVKELLKRNEIVKKDSRYVLPRPIDQLTIPDTIQGIIAASMDRLSGDLKKTMQVASVIGRDFSYKILHSVLKLGGELRTHLANLVGLEILYVKALYPELEYIFKHALTQKVAYDSLLKQRCKEIHGRIASTIENLYAGKLELHYELLAHHWELSDTPDRAIEYFILAGDKSHRNMAAAAVVDFFSRALDWIERSGEKVDPEVMFHLRAGRAESVLAMGMIEEGLKDAKEEIRLAYARGDQQRALYVLSAVPGIIYNTILKDEMPGICEEGIQLARTLKDTGSESIFMTYYSYWRYVWGMTNEFNTMYEALDMAQKSGHSRAILTAKYLLSTVERWAGKSQQSLERMDGFIEMAQSQFNINLAAIGIFNRGMALTEAGRYNEAILLLREWVDRIERNSLNIYLTRCANSMAWSYSELYNYEKAYDFNQRALENAIHLKKSPALLYSASEMRSQTEVDLMENRYEMGYVDEAWNHIAQYEAKATDPDYAFVRDRWLNRMNLLKGRICMDKGKLDIAEQIANQCLETGKQKKWLKHFGKAERLIGEVFTQKNSYEKAEDHLQSALAKFEEVGNPKQIWETFSTLAELYKTMNRFDREREHWQQAARIVTKTADSLQDIDVKETFISAVPIRKIFEGAGP